MAVSEKLSIGKILHQPNNHWAVCEERYASILVSTEMHMLTDTFGRRLVSTMRKRDIIWCALFGLRFCGGLLLLTISILRTSY
ncbi:hypothetical protein ACLOJK_015412 [Asimina triloba]